MKAVKKKNLLMLMLMPLAVFAQEENAPAPKPLYQLFHMYMEYGSGELNKDYGQRLLENLDVKMTYNQNLPGAEWLSLGFVGQVTWGYGTANLTRFLTTGSYGPITKAAVPSSMTLTGTVGFFNNIFTIGVDSGGILATTVYYTQQLPKVAGLYSHSFTFLAAPSFYMPGNQFRADGTLAQGWFDRLEMRVAYQMKFNKYVALRPEFLFNFTGTDLVAGASAKEAFMFRFNPRLQFFADQFSFFIEPRFFYTGSPSFQGLLESSNGFFWEVKVGFDILHFNFKK